MRNWLVRALGWRALILHGDPTVYDRYRWLRRFLQPGNLRTLDAGCGAGGFTFLAASVGNDATGISYSPEEIASARQRVMLLGREDVSFITQDLTEIEERETSLGKFDQIICFETIEHIEDDAALLRGLASLLSPGGRIFLTTPYKEHRPFFGENLGGLHHRWGYTHEELRELFRQAGLEVQTESYLSGWVSQKIASLMFRIGSISPTLAWVITLPLRPLRVADGFLTRVLRYPYLSVAAIARKR